MKCVILFDLVDKLHVGLRIPKIRENLIVCNSREEQNGFIDEFRIDLENEYSKTHYVEFAMAWTEQGDVYLYENENITSGAEKND